MSFQGMLEDGAQPRSTVTTSCPEDEDEEAAIAPGTMPTMTAAMTATARRDAGRSGRGAPGERMPLAAQAAARNAGMAAKYAGDMGDGTLPQGVADPIGAGGRLQNHSIE
jgi:hypothetical protein